MGVFAALIDGIQCILKLLDPKLPILRALHLI